MKRYSLLLIIILICSGVATNVLAQIDNDPTISINAPATADVGVQVRITFDATDDIGLKNIYYNLGDGGSWVGPRTCIGRICSISVLHTYAGDGRYVIRAESWDTHLPSPNGSGIRSHILSVGCPFGQNDPHNACDGFVCSPVSGCGTNDCEIGPPCTAFCVGADETDPHNECSGGVCSSVPGCGVSDDCIVGISCAFCSVVGETNPHNECRNGTCWSVPGCGVSDDCTAGISCGNVIACDWQNTGCGTSPCTDASGMGQQCGPTGCSGGSCNAGAVQCMPSVASCSGGGGGINPGISFTNPLQYNSFGELVEAIINFILKVASALIVLMIVIGAFYLVTSAGDPGRIKTGKNIIIYSLIGFLIILLSYGLIAVIKNLLGVIS